MQIDATDATRDVRLCPIPDESTGYIRPSDFTASPEQFPDTRRVPHGHASKVFIRSACENLNRSSEPRVSLITPRSRRGWRRMNRDFHTPGPFRVEQVNGDLYDLAGYESVDAFVQEVMLAAAPLPYNITDVAVRWVLLTAIRLDMMGISAQDFADRRFGDGAARLAEEFRVPEYCIASCSPDSPGYTTWTSVCKAGMIASSLLCMKPAGNSEVSSVASS